jgi:hypothetical protein
MPPEKLAKFWDKDFLSIGEHWQAEYVAGCYALNKKINELGVFQELNLIDLMKANAGEVTELACIVRTFYFFFRLLTHQPRYLTTITSFPDFCPSRGLIPGTEPLLDC